MIPNFDNIYTELELARENLTRRYLNNNEEASGRSSRAIFSAMCLLDTVKASLISMREALREHCIEEGTEHGRRCYWCHECDGFWFYTDEEKHAPECRAAIEVKT